MSTTKTKTPLFKSKTKPNTKKLSATSTPAKKAAPPPAEPVVQTKERFFNGLPVREARGDILVKPTQFDIDAATSRDPENCVYARTIKRMLQTQRAFVYTKVAYVQSLDENGNEIMERYIIKNSAQHYIQRFDKGQPVSPGGFVLHHPAPSQTLDYKAKKTRAYHKQHPEAMRLYYERAKQKVKGYPTAEPKAVFTAHTHSFRSGTGCVRFLGTFQGKLQTRREGE